MPLLSLYPAHCEKTMSVSAAAKERVASLREQLTSYRDKLERQEQWALELQTHISQTRTVVDITIPREINKAYREYIKTL